MHAFYRTDTWFMHSSSITCEFISAFCHDKSELCFCHYSHVLGRKNKVLQVCRCNCRGFQVWLHPLLEQSLQYFQTSVSLLWLLAKWKPCRSPHHVSETELSRLRVCTYWLCTELFCPRVSLYLGRVSLYLPVEGCTDIPWMFSWGFLELFSLISETMELGQC